MIKNTNIYRFAGRYLKVSNESAGTLETYPIKYSGSLLTYNNGALILPEDIHKEGLHYARVIADSGVVRLKGRSFTEDMIKFYKQEGIYDNIRLLFIPESGIKQRTSGDNKFVTKGYDVTGQNDLTQTTEANQPYLSGNIARNERFAIKEVEGTNTKEITHSQISYSSANPWSCSIIFNFEGRSFTSFLVGRTYFKSAYITDGTTGQGTRASMPRSLRNETGSVASLTLDGCFFVGKNVIVTLVANGSDNLKEYINGQLVNNVSFSTDFIFQRIFNREIHRFFGAVLFYRIQNNAMVPTQVAAEHALLRSWIPEYENITINDKQVTSSNYEAVATVAGVVIPNVTLNVNTERITNAADREFNSDTGWWGKNTGWSITGGVARAVDSAYSNSIYKGGLLTVGKWYKITFTVLNYVKGSIRLDTFSPTSITYTSDGTYTAYLNASTVNFGFVSFNTSISLTADIDNVSIQEVGWSGLKDAYDWFIANGVSQATAQQRCAAWRYPNNSADIGAIYGKLFNWYAIKIIDDALAAENSEYRVPTNTEMLALKSHLGDDAGKNMKHETNEFWTTANGDNESGFTALPSGYYDETGTFYSFESMTGFWTIDEPSSTEGKVVQLHNDLDILICEE